MRITGDLRKQSGCGYPQFACLSIFTVDFAADATQPHEELALSQPVVDEGQQLPLKLFFEAHRALP
jgi:hypothetical protein